MKQPQNKHNKALLAIAVATSLVTLATGLIVNNPRLNQLLGPIQTLLLVIFVVWHGARLYGAKGIAIFFVVSQVVSNIMENLSISTGVPFGDYHYSQGGIPFLFQVPVVIGIAYFAYGYLAWTIANILLDTVGKRIQSAAHSILVPLTAAFIMVMWDVVMDPINSTIKHYWIWEDGGGFNGVPLTNYLGWFLTVYAFYQLFVLLAGPAKRMRQQTTKLFWAMPAVIYGVTGLSFVLMYFAAKPDTIVDATGHAWDARSIYETAAIVSLFTMLFVAFVALVKIVRPPEKISSKN